MKVIISVVSLCVLVLAGCSGGGGTSSLDTIPGVDGLGHDQGFPVDVVDAADLADPGTDVSDVGPDTDILPSDPGADSDLTDGDDSGAPDTGYDAHDSGNQDVSEGIVDDLNIQCVKDLDCDDQNQCTADSCKDGKCSHDAILGCVPEDCVNGVDDNGDKRIDCDDPLCANDAACKDLPQGDTCANPFTTGAPVGAGEIGKTLEYQGDTTPMTDQYTSCGAEPKVRDAVYRLELSEPLFVTATQTFTGGDPDNPPQPVLSVYQEGCFPTDLLECWGEEETGLGAVIERTLAAGTYYFVVDGDSFWYHDWGPYMLSLAFAAPPDTETVCDDAIDDDGDGKTDCLDDDCKQEPVCNACPVEADLACGDSVQGKFEAEETDHYYTFLLDSDEDIAVTVSVPEGNGDHIDINFKDGPPLLGCDNLYVVSEQVWHVPATNSAGFSAKAGRDYVIKLILGTYDKGEYTIKLQCGDGPEDACDDGQDNDTDSLTDCEDSDCFADLICSGGKGGDVCGDAFEVNGGSPVGLTDVGDKGIEFDYWNTTKNKANDLSAACAPATAQGPDAVYRFELADPLHFNVSVEFNDFMQEPAVYLLKGDCEPGGLVGCGQTFFGLSIMDANLDAGTYYLVVDSNAIGIDGKPHADDYSVEFFFSEQSPPEDCANAADDDDDGKTDCEDPECFEDATCTGGKTGEDCASAFPVNGLEPLAQGQQYMAWNTTIGKHNDFAGDCNPFSPEGPDTAYVFKLDQTTAVTASVQFVNGFTPTLMMYGGLCGHTNQIDCQTAEMDTATVTQTLGPGQYYLVVDSGDALFMDPMADDYTLTIDAAAP